MHEEEYARQHVEAADPVPAGADQRSAIRQDNKPGHGTAMGRQRADEGPFRHGEKGTGPGVVAGSKDTAIAGEHQGSNLSRKVRQSSLRRPVWETVQPDDPVSVAGSKKRPVRGEGNRTHLRPGLAEDSIGLLLCDPPQPDRSIVAAGDEKLPVL